MEVCGYVSLSDDTCSIHILNVTKDLCEKPDHMKYTARTKRDLGCSMENAH